LAEWEWEEMGIAHTGIPWEWECQKWEWGWEGMGIE